MSNLNNLLRNYDYSFPAKLIAQSPAHPRDSAKLLVYDRSQKTVFHSTFSNLLEYLPKNCVLVMNQTKVIPARLTVTKQTGGKANLLYLDHDKTFIRVLSDHSLNLNSQVYTNKQISFTVAKKEGKYYFLKPSFSINNIYKILDQYGQAPLPPYIKHSPLKDKKLRDEYQTVFAKIAGSVAAPTASLHFTKALMKTIKKSGVDIKFVTLHVGLGTFAPLTEQNIKNKKLHYEWYKIDKSTAAFLNKNKKLGKPIIAVGTTAVRTLESASNSSGKLIKLSGDTNLFIYPPYKFKFVSGLITNFHVPKSSLMMLVASLVGRKKLLELYSMAIKKRYRLFSFGDGMIIK